MGATVMPPSIPHVAATGAIFVAAGSEALQLVLGCSSTSLGASCGDVPLGGRHGVRWRRCGGTRGRVRPVRGQRRCPRDETRATPCIAGCLGRSAHRRHTHEQRRRRWWPGGPLAGERCHGRNGRWRQAPPRSCPARLRSQAPSPGVRWVDAFAYEQEVGQSRDQVGFDFPLSEPPGLRRGATRSVRTQSGDHHRHHHATLERGRR